MSYSNLGFYVLESEKLAFISYLVIGTISLIFAIFRIGYEILRPVIDFFLGPFALLFLILGVLFFWFKMFVKEFTLKGISFLLAGSAIFVFGIFLYSFSERFDGFTLIASMIGFIVFILGFVLCIFGFFIAAKEGKVPHPSERWVLIKFMLRIALTGIFLGYFWVIFNHTLTSESGILFLLAAWLYSDALLKVKVKNMPLPPGLMTLLLLVVALGLLSLLLSLKGS